MTEQVIIEVLPAEYGDSLLVNCRRNKDSHWILIDGGTPGTRTLLGQRLKELPGSRVDLAVVSHLDADHIGGIVELLADRAQSFDFDDIWFNGFRHVPAPPGTVRGYEQAETLTTALTGMASGRQLPWNQAWKGGAVMRADDDDKTGTSLVDPPQVKTKWGMTITLLSPTPKRLTALWAGWDGYLKEVLRGESSGQTYQERGRGDEAGGDLEQLAATTTKKDNTAPNGSSIAFLMEFGGRSCLFAADAFATVLYPALARLAQRRGLKRLEVDVFKLPHHGSQANVLSPLFDVVRAKHYVVSTNSARFEHPDDVAMARVITMGGPNHAIWFNYATERTKHWDNPAWQRQYKYKVVYPKKRASGVVLTI